MGFIMSVGFIVIKESQKTEKKKKTGEKSNEIFDY